jgi:MoaA/NifB/PqqE/SkfB family radical SAM enzyme
MSSEIIKIDSNVDKDILRIELFFSNICNYKCWYCFPGYNEGTHPWPELELVIKNLSALLDYYKENLNKKIFLLHIIGGEPTLWKELGEFIRYFKENYNCVISTSSNGSRTLRWWREFGQYFDHVILSAHHERVDSKHLAEVADILYSKDVWVNATVLMDPNHWNKCLGIIDDLKKSKNRWPITAIAVYHPTIRYTEEQKRFFKRSLKRIPWPWYYLKCKRLPHRVPTLYHSDNSKKKVPHNWLKINELNKFKDWSCDIGLDTLCIDKDGRLRGSCGSSIYNLDFFYNIFDKDFKEKFNPELNPTICKFDICSCMPETNTRKHKIIPIIST